MSRELGVTFRLTWFCQGSIDEAKSEALAAVRRTRRQRKLHQVEIPEDQVWISDELLGKGGFGEVYLAEYNTRNAAAKVRLSIRYGLICLFGGHASHHGPSKTIYPAQLAQHAIGTQQSRSVGTTWRCFMHAVVASTDGSAGRGLEMVTSHLCC